MTAEQEPKYERLTLERIINVVVVAVGLPESDADIKWLKEDAGAEIFTGVNPTLSKAVFSSSHITFQAGCGLADPMNTTTDELINSATSMLDSEGDVGIIVQYGDAVIMLPSKQQIKLHAVVAVSFLSTELPMIVMPFSSPISPGQMIRVN